MKLFAISPLLEKNPELTAQKILYRLAEPERIISFCVCWEDDDGNVQINRGFRVQHCGVLGPYKGGLRFHPSVNESILKFLAFEQTFKNALTGLPLGGGKGGSDFNPKGRSDREIMRFSQAFMDELHRHIGETIDVPAGDIALPCGTQNELDESDAQSLVENDCQWLAEGANMPCTAEAIEVLDKACVFNAPGKASNAGGVALSGLEMSQNAGFTQKVFDELDEELQAIMTRIHQQCVEFGRSDSDSNKNWINYRQGANLAAFERVSSAMLAQGIG